jgi:hypothetical protein
VAIAVGSIHIDILFIFLVKVRSREARVNVLRDDAKLLVSAGSEARQVSILDGPILIQSAADKVSAVRQVRCLGLRSNESGLGGTATAVSGANRVIRLLVVDGESASQARSDLA